MPTSEARVIANKLNATHSSGPKTEEGKERSRANALKHGMTGAGIVLSQIDAAEVDRRTILFAHDFQASEEAGLILARRAAVNSVRMDRGFDQEFAALALRVRQVDAEFVAPEGVVGDEADRLRTEACQIALFDPSKEATRARQYEAAAERGFFRALKELRQLSSQNQSESKHSNTAGKDTTLGSFSQTQKSIAANQKEFDTIMKEVEREMAHQKTKPPQVAPFAIGNQIPITVGRPR